MADLKKVKVKMLRLLLQERSIIFLLFETGNKITSSSGENCSNSSKSTIILDVLPVPSSAPFLNTKRVFYSYKGTAIEKAHIFSILIRSSSTSIINIWSRTHFEYE